MPCVEATDAPPIVAVHVRGGIVDAVQATAKDVRVLTVDHDTDGAAQTDERVAVVDGERVWLWEHGLDIDPDAVARYVKANAPVEAVQS